MVKDSVVTGHTTYFQIKKATSSSTSATGYNYVRAGSYDLTVDLSTNVYFDNIKQINGEDTGIADFRYYGVMATNFVKNLEFTNCCINRFDAHQGVWNATIKDSTIGHTINVIGGGEFYLENVTKITGQNFIELRKDYGGTFEGNITIKNCTHNAYEVYYSYRGESFSETRCSNAYVINTGYSKNEEVYWLWNFGYTCYMPKSITFIGEFVTYSKNVYIYAIDYHDYYTSFVPSQDEGYVPYKLTNAIIYKGWNGDKLNICKTASPDENYMYNYIDVYEE